MKKYIFIAMLPALPFVAMAQHEEDTENGVVSLAGKKDSPLRPKKETLYSNPICLYRPVAISTGMTRKDWTKPTIRIM